MLPRYSATVLMLGAALTALLVTPPTAVDCSLGCAGRTGVAKASPNFNFNINIFIPNTPPPTETSWYAPRARYNTCPGPCVTPSKVPPPDSF